MAGIEKYYEITEVYAWQWEGNTNITIEDIPEEIRNEVTMLKVERSIKTSFTEESNQLFFNYKGYQYNLFPGDFLIFEYNEFIDGFQFICVEREKDSLKKYRKCNSILFLPTSKVLDPLNPKDAIEANAINFFNESCQALGILVDLNKKRLATCKKCGKTNKECFPTTIEEYDMYIEMLCENCLTEILDKKITAIKPKKTVNKKAEVLTSAFFAFSMHFYKSWQDCYFFIDFCKPQRSKRCAVGIPLMNMYRNNAAICIKCQALCGVCDVFKKVIAVRLDFWKFCADINSGFKLLTFRRRDR